MSKRFRDTKLTREPWYRKLSSLHKCVWDFLCDECDTAGVWLMDLDAMEFYLGESVDLKKFLEEVNKEKERVIEHGNGKLFVTGFIEFQYGELSESCIPHRKVLALLKKHNLLDRVQCRVESRVVSTLQEEEEDKEEKEELDERGSGGKQKPKRTPNITPDKSTSAALKKTYSEKIIEVKNLPDIKSQRLEVAGFITENKPGFIEPYMDLWNLSVRKYGLSEVEGISNGRLAKFKTRIREPMFDFIKILTEINQSDYLQGKTKDWKADWDWIFENDTNYLKIIEGKYRNAKN